MKLKTIITLALVLFITTTFAQKNKQERKAKRIAFITQFLELTPDESKAFWPVYEEKSKKQQEKRKLFRKSKKQNRKKLEEMSDTEVLELINSTLAIRQAQLEIDREYNNKFLKILPPKKVAKLYHLEKKFRKHQKKNKQQK
jgi:hypothetical protein